jgi:hypothetical protein
LEIRGLEGEKAALQNDLKNERLAHGLTRSRIRIIAEGSTEDIVIDDRGTSENFDSSRAAVPRYNFGRRFLPIYHGTITEEPWYTARIRASDENISMELDMHATLSYTWEYRRAKGLFGTKEPFVKASVDNPYVQFESLESWSQKPNPPRFSWGVTAGIGISTELQPVIGLVIGPSFRVRDW